LFAGKKESRQGSNLAAFLLGNRLDDRICAPSDGGYGKIQALPAKVWVTGLPILKRRT
jgi:hypothetical protein